MLLAFAAQSCDPEPINPVDAGHGGAGPSDAGPTDASTDGPHGCTLSFLGDESKEMEAQIYVLGTDEVSVPVKDGDTVPMIFPPQGGRVIFVGVHAKNLDPCGVKLTGAIRDPATMKVMVDARTVNLLPIGEGWGKSDDNDIASFANVPVCPNQWASTNLFGSTFELTIVTADRGGRSKTLTAMVTPTCAEPENQAACLCICKKDYVLGETCADAGMDAP